MRPFTSRRPTDRPADLHVESLESRRLLAATFDLVSGFVNVTPIPGQNIVQARVLDVTDGSTPTQFVIVQSSVPSDTPTPPQIPTQQQVLDYIAQGADNAVEFGPFELDDINELRINVGTESGLVILGQVLNVTARVTGAGGNDSLSGGAGNDILGASGGTNYFFAGRGNNLFNAGTGANAILGGPGFDTAAYDARTGNIDVAISPPDATPTGGQFLSSRINAVIGGQGNDRIDASAAPGPVALYGLGGNDTLIGSNFDDTLVGGAGNDSLVGTGGTNIYFAEGDGSNTLVAAPGGNDVALANGNDTLNGTFAFVANEGLAAADVAGLQSSTQPNVRVEAGVLVVEGTNTSQFFRVEEVGNETIVFISPRNDLDNPTAWRFATGTFDAISLTTGNGDNLVSLAGTAIDASIVGGNGSDTLIGGDGNDFINGGNGDNWIFGRGGNDTLTAGRGADYFSGGPGNDTLDYSARGENLIVGIGNLPDDGATGERDNVQLDITTVIGGTGNDEIATTGGVPVRFEGNGGNNTLVGGTGNDTLVAGLGNNQLFGTAGNNFFRALNGFTDTIVGGAGQDTGEFDPFDVVNLQN